LTADTAAERAGLLGIMEASDPGDGRLHESFDPNDPSHFTRQDFGWPNSLFAEFVLTAKTGRSPLPRGSAAKAR
jgi:meiotically up-regulated gene 157 (Mug157) protein